MTSPSGSSPPKYRFEDLTLDVGQRRVWRGSDALPLTNLTFELLRVLVEAAPNVVSHDELAEKVWGPRRVVTPENLSQRIMVLRDALGDSADQPRYIEGLRGQGYRLIPEVQAASTRGLPDRVSSGEAMTTLYVPVRSAKHLTSRKLIYAVAGALLLTLAFIAVNSYLRGAATHDVTTASDTSPMREQTSFVVNAPEGSTFGMAPAEPSPALSPDGKQLAFVAPFESERVLWTQTLGDLEARPLMGTNGADYPFWSPDGRSLAFHAQGRLKRIAATGGGSIRDLTVADLPPIQGGTWSANGTIVFAGSEGLYRISSEGSEPEPLTRIDHTRGEFSHRFPVMLPNETRFVYLVLSMQDEYGGLYLGSLDDPGMKRLVMRGDSNAAFGFDSSGRLHLFFVRDSALVAQPFDAARGAPTGDPVVIASEKIVTAPTVRYAAFAASGRTLIYRPRFAPSTRLVWIDRRRGIVGQQVGEEGARWRFPSLSPDGTRLVALREDRSNTSGLWLFDLVGGKRERLASGSWVSEPSGGALMSAWTPDSSQVVYSSTHPNGWSVYQRPVTGGPAERLFAGLTPAVKRVRDATDDIVLFQDNDNELWVLPFIGERQPHRLPIEGEKNHGRVSPDGRWLAYDVTEAGMTEVYVTTLPDAVERWPISTGGGSDPQWRRDGRELYYIAAEHWLMAVSVKTDPTFFAGTPEPLFRASFDGPSLAFGSAYAPAPDGQRFLVAEAIGENEPHLIAMLNWMPRRQALD